MPRILALHVGHGKTGSSYLQSWLALNAPELSRNGIAYPLQSATGRVERRAQKGLFSMGNGFVLEEILAAPDPAAALASVVPEGDAPMLLFSDERLMRRLHGKMKGMQNLAGRAGFDELRILLFIRDPLEHACSLYLQLVQAHGLADSLNDFLGYYDLHAVVHAFLEDCYHLSPTPVSCNITVFNYRRVSASLLAAMRSWLALPSGKICALLPPRERVNRSLTPWELRLLRPLNRLLGDRSAPLARCLVDRCPSLRAAALRPGRTAEIAFQERLAPVVAAINALVPPEHHLRL